MQNELLKEFGPLAFIFSWVAKHEKLATFILWVEAIAFAWVVFTYDFTTNF